MKTCISCNIAKDLSEFNNRKNRRGEVIKNNKCRECTKAYAKKHYGNNKHMYGGKTNFRRAHVQKLMLKYLSTKHCIDCQNDDIRVLEFDHLRDKSKGIAEMVAGGYAWDSILKEIDKCEIVCANCHRVRTHTRADTYRIL